MFNINAYQPGDVIANRWIYVRRRATFWNWLEVRDQTTGETAMCHLASDHVIRFLPEYRFRALIIKELNMLGCSCVPEFVSYETIKERNASYGCLVVKPFGPSLERVRNRLNMAQPGQNAKFSLMTCLHIGLETLRALREFHGAGYLHRPIEPNGFFIRQSPVQSLILVPLHARRWRKFGFNSEESLPPRPPCQPNVWTPNSVPAHWRYPLRYASINVLRGNEPTRVDQLWSWFYMLFDLTLGSTHPSNWLMDPWVYLTTINVIIEGKMAKHEKASEWLNVTPPEYMEVFKYLESMAPNDRPDYDRLMLPLLEAKRKVMESTGGSAVLDWEPGGAHYDLLRPMLENA